MIGWEGVRKEKKGKSTIWNLTLGGDGYVNYLDHGDSFMDVY